ncbi:circadian clock-controlled protein daywake-like [Bactrocera tryoni]|uniref:circadian clock-controlled protein daywake-like n=1 Tax=Bactrocera tryoni TaxID=59916 RepID=UPI001A95D677|nr:circadian clock-controlled protein daywake-like [Bactrocera tryoni]
MLLSFFMVGLSVFTTILAERVFLKEKPPFFKHCTSDMPDYEACYRSNLQSLLVEYKDGIPGLPEAYTFEPIRIRRLRIEQDELSLRLYNVAVHGISTANITKLRYDPNDYSFRARVFLPELQISADFRAHGRLLFLPINNSGKLTLEAMAVKLAFLFTLQLQDDGNRTFADPRTVRSKIVEIGDFHLNLENFLDGNTELEGTINELLNALWRDVIEVLRPTLENAINAVALTRFKSVLNFIPANYFISDVPSAAELYGEVAADLY